MPGCFVEGGKANLQRMRSGDPPKKFSVDRGELRHQRECRGSKWSRRHPIGGLLEEAS